jgi:hypothetical protein
LTKANSHDQLKTKPKRLWPGGLVICNGKC